MSRALRSIRRAPAVAAVACWEAGGSALAGVRLRPSVGADFDRPPALISQIEIYATAMLGDSEVNRPLRTVELCLRFDQIERRADRRGARGGPGRLVIASPQPKSKPFAADRPGFPVAVDQEISECRTSGGVEQLGARFDRGEHRGPLSDRRLAVHGGTGGYGGPVCSGRSALGSGAVRPSSMRVCFQSLRAALIGSMPASFHQAASLPTRCT